MATFFSYNSKKTFPIAWQPMSKEHFFPSEISKHFVEFSSPSGRIGKKRQCHGPAMVECDFRLKIHRIQTRWNGHLILIFGVTFVKFDSSTPSVVSKQLWNNGFSTFWPFRSFQLQGYVIENEIQLGLVHFQRYFDYSPGHFSSFKCKICVKSGEKKRNGSIVQALRMTDIINNCITVHCWNMDTAMFGLEMTFQLYVAS